MCRYNRPWRGYEESSGLDFINKLRFKDARLTINMIFTPFSIAAQLGNLQEVLALIETGADINVCNHIGQTAISMAAGNGHDGVVKALIAVGVDIDKTDDIGWTPLLHAIEYGHETTVQILTDAGADINHASHSGWTPMSLTRKKGIRA